MSPQSTSTYYCMYMGHHFIQPETKHCLHMLSIFIVECMHDTPEKPILLHFGRISSSTLNRERTMCPFIQHAISEYRKHERYTTGKSACNRHTQIHTHGRNENTFSHSYSCVCCESVCVIFCRFLLRQQHVCRRRRLHCRRKQYNVVRLESGFGQMMYI